MKVQLNKLRQQIEQKMKQEYEKNLQKEIKTIEGRAKRDTSATIKRLVDKKVNQQLRAKVDQVKAELKNDQKKEIASEQQSKETQLQLEMIQFSREKSQEDLKRIREEAELKEKELQFQHEKEALIKYVKLYNNNGFDRHLYDEALQLAYEKDQLVKYKHQVVQLTNRAGIKDLMDDSVQVSPITQPYISEENEANSLTKYLQTPANDFIHTESRTLAEQIIAKVQTNMTSTPIVDVSTKNRSAVLSTSDEMCLEPLLAECYPLEEVKSQEAFQRHIPLPETASQRLRTILLPQLYRLFDILAIPFTERMKFVVSAHCMDPNELEEKVMYKIGQLKKLLPQMEKELEMISRREQIKERLKGKTAHNERVALLNELRRLTRQLTVVLHVWKQHNKLPLTYRGMDYLNIMPITNPTQNIS